MTLTRRHALTTLAAAAACAASPFRSLALTPGKNPQPVPDGPVTPLAVKITSSTIGTVTTDFAGFSIEKAQIGHGLYRPSNKGLLALFKLLRPSILRIGGDSSDKIVWTPNGKGGTYPQVAPSDIKQFAAFVRATGWKCLYGINLAGSANGKTTPELAAAEVAFAVAEFGPSLYGIEIGNEPDAYAKPHRQYEGKPWDLQTYETTWNLYRDAILARSPGVNITGPAAGHLAPWTIPFTEHQTKAKISLLTDHYYRGPGPSPNPGPGPGTDAALAKLLAPDTLLVSNLKLMREAQQRTGIPFRLGETNSYTNPSLHGISDTYATSLWSLDFLYTCAIGGATGVNFHGGKTEPYSPLMDNQTDIVNVPPEFYGIVLFTMAGTGAIQQTELTAPALASDDVPGTPAPTAYALKTPTGINVTVINKYATRNLRVTLKLPTPARSADLLCLTQRSPGAATPTLDATSGVTLQGATIATDGKFTPATAYSIPVTGQEITCFVPALSAVLIRTT